MMSLESSSLRTCPDPIFIIGSPRSGTTAFARALAKHSQLSTSGETGFLFHLFGNDAVKKAFEKQQRRSNGGWFQVNNVGRAEFSQYLGIGVNALLTSRSGGKRWVEQTPLYTLMTEELVDMFPGAYFLHVLRDGRRVVNSMINFLELFEEEKRVEMSKFIGPWSTDFRSACQAWCQYVDKALDFCATHPERCFTIRNERAAEDAKEAFAEIFRFIGVSHEAGPVDFFRSKRVNTSFPNQSRDSRQGSGSSTPWATWSAEWREIFRQEAGPTLVRCDPASTAELARTS